MATDAKELTKLLSEANKARKAIYFVLDYVDLVNSHRDDFPAETQMAGSRIKDHASEIEKYVEEIKGHINTILDKMPLDTEEIKNATDKMLLYGGDISQTMNWVLAEQKRYSENSYWWRHWQAIYDILREQKGRQ
jgi:peptidoglycan hydrolase CwlO-like protein